MTDPRRLSHEAAEELISASLTNDLTDPERASLDAHLAGCARCRDTAAAFAESRRVLSGIRHVPAPRDLGARVRAGVERGRFGAVPWWRRPAFAIASTAALAAAAVGLAVIIGLPRTPPPVASASPTASLSGTPGPSPTSLASPTPSGSPLETPEPSLAPAPPVYRLEYAFDVPGDINQGISMRIVDQAGATVRTLDAGGQLRAGLPVAAALSPDGVWLAVRLFQDAKGTELLYAIEVHGDGLVALGETQSSSFLTLAWSPEDGRYLAYTLVATGETADPAGSADVFIFEPASGAVTRLTATRDTYAGSWRCCGSSGSTLWVSRTKDSYPVTLRDDAPVPTGVVAGPDTIEGAVAANAFVPRFSPDGQTVIFWQGTLEQTDVGARFPTGGTLVVAAGDAFGTASDGRQALLTNRPDPIGTAQVAWAPDSDAYAVWGVGLVDSEVDGSTVYFGHRSREGGTISDRQRLDAGDVPAGSLVRDVALGPDGRHLAITVGFPIPGDLAQPVAELRLVTRYFDQRADEVETLGPAAIWVGPGIYAP